MKRLRFFSLAMLLALGTAASAVTPPHVKTERTTSYADYQNGYSAGKRETEQNKCIDGNDFPQRYESYRQRVTSYQDSAPSQDEYDYYQGYLDGMEEGYNTPVVCGGTGGGGGTGPGTGPGGGDGPIDPVFD